MTRYELFRKRIAPALFLCVVGLIAYDACNKQQRTHATIVLDFGAAAAEVREVNAELFSDGESIVVFQRTALPGGGIGPCRFETAMPADTGELQIDLRLATRMVSSRKLIRPLEGSVTTVPLEDLVRLR